MASLYFLGTGTSTGIPQLGCTCDTCRSVDSRDRRLRTSALLVTDEEKRLLIDCGPDFREQMLSLPPETRYNRLDGVLVTHEHYDHVGGLDDLRPFSVFGRVPVFAEPVCAAHLRERIPYCFGESRYPGVPSLNLCPIPFGEPFIVAGEKVVPIKVMHGHLPILGFRVGRLGYITDASSLDDTVLLQLKGVEVLVMNALRLTSHHSHQSIGKALSVIERIKPQRAYLIHFSHEAGKHSFLQESLPEGVYAAYDGLKIDF